ncbi:MULTISPECIES: hypothetical protein [Arcobacter]|uniref:Membrane protein n=2 Tax=Arcobacter TaxID=28196 RepID=A0AAE7B3H9_9BACT|nr:MULTISPECIES: hypothetical protein [Arcobacter]MCB9096755.1 hypothetical protein [Arcobacter sp.]NCB13843.1 hypothetical protein [Erysipelotrichia bacterium]QKE26594.1 putative membrane protein [Arcobacter aquimarinus]QKF90384.1 putative membrane protein [Arcobacter cloacae]RXI31363.1 hypothetical protein CP986_11500 [Arcobacter aquimarinus]
MSTLMNCPECNHEILSRMGTICPNCGFTVGYFNGDKRRKIYGKFFALTVFAPFISFITIIFASVNKYTMMIAIALFFYFAIKSCPLLFKDLFVTKFEKIFFWFVWILVNSMLFTMIFNILRKGFEA